MGNKFPFRRLCSAVESRSSFPSYSGRLRLGLPDFNHHSEYESSVKTTCRLLCSERSASVRWDLLAVSPPSALGSVKHLLDIGHRVHEISISVERKEGRKEGEKTDATSLWGRNDSCPCCKHFFAAVVAVAWPWGAQGGAGGTPVRSGCPSPTQPPGSREMSPPPGIYKVFEQVISAQTRLQETLLVIPPQPRQRAGGLIFDG